jgi:pheromone alpha factor receptor
MNISAPFNSNNENFTSLYGTGSQNVTITLSDINFWYLHQVRLAISEGTQLGALFVMFLVTWVMTTAPKRRTPVFCLNMLALGIGIMRSLFYSVTLLTRFNEIYCWFTGDISYATPGDRAVTIVAVLFNYCLIIVVNIALVLNAHTVCRGTRKIYYWPIVTISSIFLLVLVAWRFAFLVLNIQGALGTSMWIYRHHWFQMVSVAFETGSIWWFCFIFCGKLISTQRERRKIGMKGWPATQVLTSMAGATMIIPCKC